MAKFILEGMWLHQPETRVCQTLEEAIAFAAIALENNSWRPQRVKDEQGNVILDDHALTTETERWSSGTRHFDI